MTEEKSITEERDTEEQDVQDNVETAAEEPAQPLSWYIIQCFSNYEYKVQKRIEYIIQEKGWQSQITRVLIPEEETIEIKNNKRVERISKIYPGYAFIQCAMTDEIWLSIRQIPGVTKFIGTKNEATPVTEEEILKVLRKVGDKTKKIEVDFEEGEIIKVIAGPFRGYSGPIAEINAERGKLKALISIFGRETPVELDFDQLEKAVNK